MGKRAGIYIRVSTEKQADPDKVSPEEQEKDTRALCAARGHQVVEVYRDIEKYRVGGRLVEPSATKNDRPAWLRMLADVDSGRINLVVAWKTDRLYRGIHPPVLEIMKRVDAGKLDVELVKDTFDRKTAAVLAWAGGVELESRRERHEMGVAGALAKGRWWMTNPPYGYDYKDFSFPVNAVEAKMVREIWRWYGQGVSWQEIRKRLIAAGYSQKGRTIERKHTWSMACLRAILGRDAYHTGKLEIVWAGETYSIDIEPIIDAETWQAVQERRKTYRAYPAGNLKEQALAAGKVYCQACDVRMSVIGSKSGNGRKYLYYRCNNSARYVRSEGCARYANIETLDAELWRRLWGIISNPEKLIEALQARIEGLQAEETDAAGEIKRLTRQLDDLADERQAVITMRRKKIITEADVKKQLAGLESQAAEIERKLSEKRLLVGGRAERLQAMARAFSQDLQAGWEGIDQQPEDEEKKRAIFAARRQLVERLVTRIDVGPRGELEIKTVFDFGDDQGDSGASSPGGNGSNGGLRINAIGGQSNSTEAQTFSVEIKV